MKKTRIIKLIWIFFFCLLIGFGVVIQSVSADFSKLSYLQIFYALVVGSPILATLIIKLSFERLTRNISNCGLIIFLKVLVFAIFVSIMIFLNYLFLSIFGDTITEDIGGLLILFLIAYGTLFISFKDGKICVF